MDIVSSLWLPHPRRRFEIKQAAAKTCASLPGDLSMKCNYVRDARTCQGRLMAAARPARRNYTAHTSHGTLLGVTCLHSPSSYWQPLNGFSTPGNRNGTAGVP